MSGPINMRRMMHFAQLAKATYDKRLDRRAEHIDRYPEVTEVRVADDQTKVNVFEADDKTVIAFRGTANLKNALDDIEFFKSKDKCLGVHLHRGFRSAAQAIYVKLPRLVKGRAVYLTGHSSGGALAVIVAMYLLKEGHKVEGVYTFGQPKVTCKQGARVYDNLPLIRIVNDMDIVPLLPPTTFCNCFNPYKHFGAEIYLPDNRPDGYTVSFGQDTHTSGNYKAAKRVVTNSIFEDVKDHFIDNYIKQIQKRIDADS